MREGVKFFFIISAAWLLCGCAHYSCGSGSKIPFTTIYIAPVKNDSLAHHTQAVLSSQIRRKISSHPGVKLSNSNDSDVSLIVTITNFNQSVATTMPDDTIMAKSFTLTMAAKCSLYDNRTNECLFKDHTVFASIDSRTEGDFQWNKVKSISPLSEKLANKIYDIVCNPW